MSEATANCLTILEATCIVGGYWLLWAAAGWKVALGIFLVHWAINLDQFIHRAKMRESS